MITKNGINLLLTHHGLDPESSSDQDVANAIANSMTEDEASDLENRARSGEQARLELAESDLTRYAARIGQSPTALAYWRDALLKNRAGARAALEALPETTRRQPLHNRANAGNPQPVDQATRDPEAAANTRALAIRNRANSLLRDNPKLKFPQAWKQAESEIPAHTTNNPK